MREEQEPNTPLAAVIGIAFAIVLFVVVVVLQAFFYRAKQDEGLRKAVAVAPEELSQLKAQQEELLNSYKLIDPRKGVVAVPIGVAMGLLVRDGGKTPWPEVQPPPMPAPTPAVPARRPAVPARTPAPPPAKR